jgi:hypothetical protein
MPGVPAVAPAVGGLFDPSHLERQIAPMTSPSVTVQADTLAVTFVGVGIP